ncbi:MAG: DUF4907 domain-containing protein [Bacteroidia bacterium]
MKKLTYRLILLTGLSLGCGNEKKDDNDTTSVPVSKNPLGALDEMEEGKGTPPTPPTNVELKTFSGSGGWGYDIYIEGKKSIHQPMIPAVPGNQVFASEKDAKDAGSLMVYKIKHGVLPPAVSPAELDSMHVVYTK